MTALFSAIWSALTSALLGNLGGIQGKLASIVLKYGGQYLYDLLVKLEKDMLRKKAEAAAKVEYDKVIAKPDSTADERAAAYEKLINSNT